MLNIENFSTKKKFLKKNNLRAQGTIEYLIIIAIVVVIALVVVGLLTGFFSTGSGVTTTQQQIGQQAQTISITESASTQNGEVLLQIQSKETSPIEIHTINIDGEEENYYANNLVTLGDEKIFIIPTTKLCQEGTTKTIQNAKITYTEKNITKIQEYKNITIICSDYELLETNKLATTTPANQNLCTENNWEYVDATCQENNEKTRTWTKTGTCENGIQKPNTEQIECTYGTATYTLTINFNGQGNATVNQNNYSTTLTFEEGTSVTLNATPQTGWEFSNWSGSENSSTQTFQITMNQNKTLTANFIEKPEEIFFELNGTIYCPNANIGDTGEINGTTYTAYDNIGLYTIRTNQALLETACTSKITSFNSDNSSTGGLFHNSSLNPNITHWDTSNVTNMTYMFRNATNFNQPIGNWNTQKVTNMSYMFRDATNFNQPIGNWNTQKVTAMYYMFMNASSFNQPIGDWNTSNVTNMNLMFSNATNFNQPIGNWNTQKVTTMAYMFSNATNFNQPIGDWNTSNVTDMSYMFNYATNFNQPLNNWNTQKVTTITYMFSRATNFNQNISEWNISKVTNYNGYDELANAWADTNKPNFEDGRYQTFTTTNNYLFTSNNYGQTWEARDLINDARWREIVMSSDGKYQITGNDDIDHIYLSDDYGQTWSQVGSNRDWYRTKAISNSGQYMISTSNNDYLYVSNDYGQTWTPKSEQKLWLDADMSGDGKYQTAIVDSTYGIFRSEDYGQTWTQLNQISQNGGISIAISNSGQYQTIADGGSNYLYVSNDYGQTWANKAVIKDWRFIKMSQSGQYQTAIPYNLNNGEHIYVSNDYGQTWTPKSEQTLWSDQGSLDISNSGQYQTIVTYSNSGYIFTSNDYGETWINKITTAEQIKAVAISGSGRYQTVISWYGSMYRSDDYGQTWTNMGSNNAGTTEKVSQIEIS